MNNAELDAATLASQIVYDCQLFVLDETTSTNDEVVRRACEVGSVPAVPLVVLSSTQTSGRGRLGRLWASPAGGLYLSVLLAVGGAEEGNSRLASLSPLVALAVRDALQVFTGSEILVKWPNDVLLATGKRAGKHAGRHADKHAGKLAGILIEIKPVAALCNEAPNNGLCVVIGIGINVYRSNAKAHEAAAYLNDGSDQCLQLERVASAVINELLRQVAAWQAEGCSPGSFVSSYTSHMVGIGETVCVRNAYGDEIAQGTVKGIDKYGRLLLQNAYETIAVTSGEVTLKNS